MTEENQQLFTCFLPVLHSVTDCQHDEYKGEFPADDGDEIVEDIVQFADCGRCAEGGEDDSHLVESLAAE